MSSEPDVSVVIPTHNRADLVGDAIASCARSGCCVEAVVVDDGSDDETPQVLERLRADWHGRALDGGELRVRLFLQDCAGPAAARNRGLREACGEYVKFLDSDDQLLPGALAREVQSARGSGVDALLTGWQERTLVEGRERAEARRHKPAPDLSGGVDDMLKGRAPWTAAALYRRAFVRDLAWRADDGKADDWGWVWTVCLAGARFGRLPIESAIYFDHVGTRVSQIGDVFWRSTEVRQRILRRVENQLADRGQLTTDRRSALARYFCHDAKPICERNPAAWSDLWRHCRNLDSRFQLRPHDPLTRLCVGLLGPERGIRVFVVLRRALRSIVPRRKRS